MKPADILLRVWVRGRVGVRARGDGVGSPGGSVSLEQVPTYWWHLSRHPFDSTAVGLATSVDHGSKGPLGWHENSSLRGVFRSATCRQILDVDLLQTVHALARKTRYIENAHVCQLVFW